MQHYSHYKLPITINPLEYGKLLDQSNNKFIMQLPTKNVAVINQYDKENFIRIFKNGDLVLEYKDTIIHDTSFSRFINDTKFIFENNKIISTQILSTSGLITIHEFNNNPLYFTFESNNQNQFISWFYLVYYHFKVLFWNYRNWGFIDWIITIYLYSIILLIVFAIPYFIISKLLFINILSILVSLFNNTDSSLLISGINFYSMKGNIVKLRKVVKDNKWNDLEYKIDNHTFSNILFKSLLNRFWDKIENEFTNDNHMFILFKIKYISGETLSIGKLQRLNKEDKSWYIQFMLDFIALKNEFYKESQIDSLIFSYGFKNGKAENKYAIPFRGSYQSYGKSQIPISMNPLDFGKIVDKIESENNTIYIVHNDKGETITFIEFKNHNEIKISKSGNALITFKDIKSESGFIRLIDNNKFYFENGQQILFTKEINTKFINRTKISKNIVNNFITLDIETYIKDGLMTPYLICFYDGKDFFSFYLSNYNSVEEMMIDCLKSILVRKYNYYKVYAHNMAKFDIIFLLKYLVKLGKIKPIIHNGKFISITISYGDNDQYQIEFKDSILLLLYSLKSLCISFKIEDQKTIFPHLFVNENNLNYEGIVPNFEEFIEISRSEYKEYKNKFNSNLWNLKFEAIKYCKIDCVSLYQIIYKFNSMIFKLFSLNIHRYPTLSSLAFNIFRAKFMKESNIPQLSGKIADDIRKGYTGGAVDMYIPESKPGIDIKCYDVNSLYPSQMHDQLMPIGTPTYFEGNILRINPNAFGFFYCEIIAPGDIKHPILQTHVKFNGGTRTIAPIGTWEDMMFSEELINAKKYNYQINILWGYVFKKKNIFKNYVNFLFKIRSKYPKTDPMNFITKILMNSLYGRFGMNDNFENIEVIHKDYYPDFENKYLDNITDKIELDDYILIFYMSPDDIKNDHKTSVGIAAAITAYSRIHMSQFKNNPNINLYYTDTDSVYTDSNIDKSLIDPKTLGKLKLENICKRGIFLAAKLYCLETESTKIIIKVKGLKNTSSLIYDDFKNLLYENFMIERSHNKWFRNLSESKINIITQIYSIKVTDNKRELIYDKNKKLIGTKAYKIDKNKIIIN